MTGLRNLLRENGVSDNKGDRKIRFIYKINWEKDSFKPRETHCAFFFCGMNYESKIGEDRSVMEPDSTII